MSGQKKYHLTPLKSPLPQIFSKYHADVILSRLRDTLDITNNLREVSKNTGRANHVCMIVSSRRRDMPLTVGCPS